MANQSYNTAKYYSFTDNDDGIRCDHCDLVKVCNTDTISYSVSLTNIPRFNANILPPKNRALISINDPCTYIYVVKSGAFKSHIVTNNGSTQIVDFHFPGEIIGLESIALGYHQYTSDELVPSKVCQIPVRNELLSEQTLITFLQCQTMALSRRINQYHGALRILGSRTVERSISIFLLNISRRLRKDVHDSCQIDLPMSREHIANHLGIANETVSRALTQLHKMNVLKVQGRHIEIIDVTRLRQIAGDFV